LNPNHISAYSLTVEPGTELKRLVKKNKVIMPRNKLDLEMLTFTRQFLINQGYNAYEISNFSKPNFECKHNLNYWNSGPYLAFGPSAHGYDLVNRWSNIRSIDGYIKKLRNFENPIVNIEMSSKSNKFNETLLNGLRLKKGVCLRKLKSLDQNYYEYLNHGLSKWKKEICIDNNYLSLTKEGIPFLDSILPDLFI
jgi:oxygen-independent coproporphyrinogen-3 oxidase